MKPVDKRVSHTRIQGLAGHLSVLAAVCGASGHGLRYSNPNAATCPKCRAHRKQHQAAARARFEAALKNLSTRHSTSPSGT